LNIKIMIKNDGKKLFEGKGIEGLKKADEILR
jgi:hypothetical protein